jgi:protein O-mannosyl-transferase
VRRALPALLLAAAVGLAYAGTLDVPFVFDDRSAIVENPAIHAPDLSPAALARAAAGFPTGRWLTNLTFAVDHAAGGLAPRGYHLVNLAIHLAAALLVLRLGREVLARGGGLTPAAAGRAALVAALLFAVHPVQTQAVTYVVQRATSLGATLGLAALWWWLAALEASGPARRRRLGAAALLWLLAVGAKESLVVLPVLALVLAAACDERLRARARTAWRDQPRHAAGLLVAGLGLGAALVVLLASPYADTITGEQARLGVGVGARLLSQPRALLRELSLLAFPWPSRLRLDPAFAPSAGLLDPPATALALLGLLGLVAAAVALRRRAPLVTLAVGWFLGALLVEQTVLPIDLVAEHRLYLAGVGPLWALSAGLERWLGGRGAPALVATPGPWLVAAPLAALLAAGTVVRNADWHSPEILLGAEGSSPRGLLDVGAARFARGDAAGAAQAFERVLALEPASEEARHDLAELALATGDLATAEARFRALLALNPAYVPAWTGLGWTLHLAGRAVEAEEATRRAVALAPAYAPARINLSVQVLARGDRAGARAELEALLAVDPGAGLALGNLARLDLQEGRAAEALARARRFVALDGAEAEPWALLGLALAATGDPAGAAQAYAEALRRDPSQREARAGLAALPRR